jgi:CBS domain containing-hemolysin-like protein
LGHSEEEFRLLLTDSQEKAGASPLARDLVLNALDLRRRIVRDVMRPRQEIVAFDTDSSISECLALAERTRYSRFPLSDQGNVDKTPGVVHIKDLYAMRSKSRTAGDLLPVARKLAYFPETARLESVLKVFLDRKMHFGIVVDEYGGTIGMLTLENVLEELVGQIQDEFDQEKPLLVKKGESEWEIDGSLPLHELAELVGEPLTDERITTTSGWMTQALGGFPKDGDILRIGQFKARVLETDGLRVTKLALVKIPPPEPESET